MGSRLLISVRDDNEARDALTAGADLIDMKEPLHGALGAVDVATIEGVVAAIAGHVPASVALGELLAPASRKLAAQLPPGISFAKFGLAGCAERANWPTLLDASLAELPAETGAVAVIYADWLRARAPEPARVLDVATETGCRAVLVDTWNKSAGGLLQLWTLDQCAQLVEQVQAAGMLAVLAGSLTSAVIERLLPLAPDYVAVRGAVCDGTRTDRLDPRRIRELKRLVGSAARSDSARCLLPTISKHE